MLDPLPEPLLLPFVLALLMLLALALPGLLTLLAELTDPWAESDAEDEGRSAEPLAMEASAAEAAFTIARYRCKRILFSKEGHRGEPRGDDRVPSAHATEGTVDEAEQTTASGGPCEVEDRSIATAKAKEQGISRAGSRA